MNTSVEQMNEEADRRVGIVFRTMLLFTVAMVLGPISTYFLSKSYVFEGELLKKIFFFFKYSFLKLKFYFKGYFLVSPDSSFIYSAISGLNF